MRLIDADALIQKLVKNGWLKMDSLKDSAEMIAVQAAIDDAPTIPITPPPNDPLTLEELREMSEEQVWLVPLLGQEFEEPDSEYYMVPHWWTVRMFQLSDEDIASYGGAWVAYRRKPEEAD